MASNDGKLRTVVLNNTCPNCGKNLIAFPWNNAAWSAQCDNGACIAYRQGKVVKADQIKENQPLTRQYRQAVFERALNSLEVKFEKGILPFVVSNTPTRGGE